MSAPSSLYKHNKARLVEESRKRSLPHEGFTVNELRKNLKKYFKAHPEEISETGTCTDLSDSSDDQVWSSPSKTVQDVTRKESDEMNQGNETGKEENLPNSDLHHAMKDWHISFDVTDDAVEFLEGLEELASTYGIEKEKLIPALPRIFRGIANLWHRNNATSWTTWEEFTEDFKLYFFPRNYETNLLERIIARKQKYREKFIIYLTDMQTLFRRYGKMKEEEKLHRIFENMDTNYKYYVKRTDFSSLNELILLCGNFEALTEEKDQLVRQTSHGFNEQVHSSRNVSSKKKEDPNFIQNYNKFECCWNCGRRGHVYTECHAKRQFFCSQCGKIGTLTRDCCKAGQQSERIRKTFTVKQSKIDDRPYIKINIFDEEYKALIDTGSTTTYINKKVYEKCRKLSVPITYSKEEIELADGSKDFVTKSLQLKIRICDSEIKHRVYVLPDSTTIILGTDIMKKIGFHNILNQRINLQNTRKNKKNRILTSLPGKPATHVEKAKKNAAQEDKLQQKISATENVQKVQSRRNKPKKMTKTKKTKTRDSKHEKPSNVLFQSSIMQKTPPLPAAAAYTVSTGPPPQPADSGGAERKKKKKRYGRKRRRGPKLADGARLSN